MATLLGGERYIDEDIYEEVKRNHYNEFDNDTISDDYVREGYESEDW